MRARWCGLVLAVVAAVAAGPACAGGGVVTHVTDGDTLWVRMDGARAGAKPLKLRLQGIDAPERCQAWGPQAHDALAGHVLKRRVDVQTKARDVYHRAVARVTLEGEDVGAWMVTHGHAWSDHPPHHRQGPYAAQEARARAGRRGLFSLPDPMEPKAFRRMHGACPSLRH